SRSCPPSFDHPRMIQPCDAEWEATRSLHGLEEASTGRNQHSLSQKGSMADARPEPTATVHRNAKHRAPLRAASSLAPRSLRSRSRSRWSDSPSVASTWRNSPAEGQQVPEAAELVAPRSPRPPPTGAGPDGKRRQGVLRAASDLAPASRAGTESFNSVGRGGQHEDVCMKEPLPAEIPDAQPRDSHDAYDVNEVGLQPTIPGIAAAGSQHDEGAMGDEARLEVTNHSRTRTPEQVTLTLPDAPAAAGPDGKRRQRVLRAASDLAPASRAGTESFNSVGRGGQHEDVCMKEPLPAETPDAQPRDSHDAYDVNEVGLQPTIPGIAAAGSQHSHTTLADGVQHQVTNHVHTHTVRQALAGATGPAPDAAETLTWLVRGSSAATELEDSQSSQGSQKEPGWCSANLVSIQDTESGIALQTRKVPTDPPAPPNPPTSAVAPVRKAYLKHRLVGKQSLGPRLGFAPSLERPARLGSKLLRARLGHSLQPPERGFLVRVHGDGWGSGQGSYLATVTEADTTTFTVIRRGDCYGSWDETHVLKTCCSIMARTSSKEHVFLASAKATRA
ncbi:DNA polymerase alpha-associated DNA helicase A, partial [Durusdinium trenchii]